MKHFITRTIKLILGLFLYSLGAVLGIRANIGLAPWEAFSIGFSKITGISYGNIVILTGIIILFIVVILKEKIGIGTILNTLLIGVISDTLLSLKIIPLMNNFISGIGLLILGQVIISLGTYFYIGQGLGSGPRDSLMTALSKRFPRLPIGVIRGGIEGTVLIIGWLLGAKVGLGTVIAVFGISFIIQTTFKILNFDVKSIKHQGFFETIRLFR